MESNESRKRDGSGWEQFRLTMGSPKDLKTEAFAAAKSGDLSYFTQRKSLHGILTQTNEKGHSLLMLSAYYGHVDVTNYLLTLGADPNFKDASGNSILMGVSFKGHLEIAKMLLKHGAEVYYRNPRGQDAIDYALLFGRTEMVEYLSSVTNSKPNTSSQLFLWIKFYLAFLKSFFTTRLANKGGLQ